MNKTLVLISCVFLILGCANSDYVKIDNRLEEKIRLIINFYQEEVSESSNNIFDPPIYEVSFTEREGKCFLIVNTNYFYRSEFDGFKFLNNKLVAFYNVNSRCNGKLIRISNSKDVKILDDYQNEEEALDNYSPAWWEFEIQEDKIIVTNQGKHKIQFN